jgi:hypothetical protein
MEDGSAPEEACILPDMPHYRSEKISVFRTALSLINKFPLVCLGWSIETLLSIKR